jgi:coenzyme F420 biosynthesis associated uncharacterized protein
VTAVALPESPAAPTPVDWGFAARVARRMSKRNALSDCYLLDSLHRDFSEVTVEAESLVADFTGLRAPGQASAAVLDRSQWIDANVASMQRMLAPFTERVGERLAHSPIAPIGRAAAGAEMGVLLGYLSQRVLGQYDLLVPTDEINGAPVQPVDDAVYYVGANIVALEKRFAFRPRDFRLWIAIHEVTHRAQFTGVPWMREYFLSLVKDSLGMLDADPSRLLTAINRAIDAVRAGRNPLDDGGLIGLIATPEQRVSLTKVQALMSLLEGHGNAVMNHLGAGHVAGQERMARVLHARRQARGMSGQMQKLLGFEMKMRQYEVGERFVLEIERVAGLAALDVVWTRPQTLPTLEELAEPRTWLDRMNGRRLPSSGVV